jgi:hypothetical protein
MAAIGELYYSLKLDPASVGALKGQLQSLEAELGGNLGSSGAAAAGLKAVSAEVKTISSEVKSLGGAGGGAGFSALRGESESLIAALKNQVATVRDLRQANQITSAEAEAQLTELQGKAIAFFNAAKEAGTATNAELRQLSQAAASAQRTIDQLNNRATFGGLRSQVGGAIHDAAEGGAFAEFGEKAGERIKEGLSEGAQELANLVPGLGKVSSLAGEAATSFGGLGVAAAGVAVPLLALTAGFTAFGVAIENSIKFAGQIVDLSNKTGLATDTIQSLKFVADQTGTSLEGLANNAFQLERRVAALGGPSRQTQAALREIGVEAKNANGSLKDADTLYKEVTDGLSKIENPSRQAALAFQLFGRQGGEVLQAIRDLGAGFGFAEQRARSLGIIIERDQLEGLKYYEDQVNRVRAQWNTFVVQGASLVLPYFERFTQKISDILQWVQHNRTQIALWGQGINDVATIFVGAGQVMLAPIAGIGAAIGQVSVQIEQFGSAAARAFDAVTHPSVDSIAKLEAASTQAKAALNLGSVVEAFGQGFAGQLDTGYATLEKGARQLSATLDGKLRPSAQVTSGEVHKLGTEINFAGDAARDPWAEYLKTEKLREFTDGLKTLTLTQLQNVVATEYAVAARTHDEAAIQRLQAAQQAYRSLLEQETNLTKQFAAEKADEVFKNQLKTQTIGDLIRLENEYKSKMDNTNLSIKDRQDAANREKEILDELKIREEAYTKALQASYTARITLAAQEDRDAKARAERQNLYARNQYQQSRQEARGAETADQKAQALIDQSNQLPTPVYADYGNVLASNAQPLADWRQKLADAAEEAGTDSVLYRILGKDVEDLSRSFADLSTGYAAYGDRLKAVDQDTANSVTRFQQWREGIATNTTYLAGFISKLSVPELQKLADDFQKNGASAEAFALVVTELSSRTDAFRESLAPLVQTLDEFDTGGLEVRADEIERLVNNPPDLSEFENPIQAAADYLETVDTGLGGLFDDIDRAMARTTDPAQLAKLQQLRDTLAAVVDLRVKLNPGFTGTELADGTIVPEIRAADNSRGGDTGGRGSAEPPSITPPPPSPRDTHYDQTIASVLDTGAKDFAGILDAAFGRGSLTVGQAIEKAGANVANAIGSKLVADSASQLAGGLGSLLGLGAAANPLLGLGLGIGAMFLGNLLNGGSSSSQAANSSTPKNAPISSLQLTINQANSFSLGYSFDDPRVQGQVEGYATAIARQIVSEALRLTGNKNPTPAVS